MNPIIAHLVGDFILQNEWMAINKKDRSLPCIVHLIVYLAPFLFCQLSWWQVALIGIQHYIQDRSSFIFWWLKAYKHIPKEHWNGMPLYVDQAFHLLWIEMVVLMGGL